MFRAIDKIKSDKRGFTVVELMVTVVIMALVAGLICQLMGSIWKKYRMVENLYIIQSEVQAVVRAFQADASTGSLATATNVDMFYEDLDALEANKSFASCKELGTFQENADGSLYFPKRAETTDEALANKTYTYLFVYKNYFYVLNGGSDTAYRFKFTDEAKINIKYEVAVDAFQKIDNVEGPTRSDGSGHTYLPSGITVTVESAPEYDFHYELHTSFSLKNTMDSGKNQLNMNNSSVYALTSEHVAGYTNGVLPNFPNVTNSNNLDNPYVAELGKSYSHLQDAATVIKYISLYNFNYGSPTGNDGGMTVGTNCGVSFLMAGSQIGEGVKNTLRSFRDNVLRGNALGEIIIDKYYNSWSPAIIEITSKNDTVRKVLTEAVVGTAYLIEMAN